LWCGDGVVTVSNTNVAQNKCAWSCGAIVNASVKTFDPDTKVSNGSLRSTQFVLERETLAMKKLEFPAESGVVQMTKSDGKGDGLPGLRKVLAAHLNQTILTTILVKEVAMVITANFIIILVVVVNR
jgi:hypothetical protein